MLTILETRLQEYRDNKHNEINIYAPQEYYIKQVEEYNQKVKTLEDLINALR